MRIKKWHCEKTECLRRGGWRPNLQPWLFAIKPELFCYLSHPWISSRGGLREKEEAKREVQKKAARYGPGKLCFPPRERKRFSKITFFYVCLYACMYVWMYACMCPSIDQIGIKMQGGALAIFWPFFLGDIFPQHVFFFVEGPQNDGRVNSRRCVFSFFLGNMCNPCQGPSQGSWSKLGSFFFLAPSEGRLPESGRHGPG